VSAPRSSRCSYWPLPRRPAALFRWTRRRTIHYTAIRSRSRGVPRRRRRHRSSAARPAPPPLPRRRASSCRSGRRARRRRGAPQRRAAELLLDTAPTDRDRARGTGARGYRPGVRHAIRITGVTARPARSSPSRASTWRAPGGAALGDRAPVPASRSTACSVATFWTRSRSRSTRRPGGSRCGRAESTWVRSWSSRRLGYPPCARRAADRPLPARACSCGVGRGGLELIRRTRPRVVILDLHLAASKASTSLARGGDVRGPPARHRRIDRRCQPGYRGEGRGRRVRRLPAQACRRGHPGDGARPILED